MQLVYEFGARELEPVVETARQALGNSPYSVNAWPNVGDAFCAPDNSLISTASRLTKKELASFSLHPSNGLIRYALVTCPFFAGSSHSAYLGTIEYLGDDYKPLWDLILAVPGLSFACLGFEEGVEINDGILTVESFPWNEWPLVIGAIRDQSQQRWQIKSGPEMKWFAQTS